MLHEIEAFGGPIDGSNMKVGKWAVLRELYRQHVLTTRTTSPKAIVASAAWTERPRVVAEAYSRFASGVCQGGAALGWSAGDSSTGWAAAIFAIAGVGAVAMAVDRGDESAACEAVEQTLPASPMGKKPASKLSQPTFFLSGEFRVQGLRDSDDLQNELTKRGCDG